MALNPAHVQNFETLRRAFANNGAALMQCTRVSDGKEVTVIAMVNRNPDDSFDFLPVAAMLEDPFNELNPPEGASYAPL